VTTVDTDERFRFEGLPPGEYTLWIVGTDVRRAGIMVEDETPVEVELSLPPVARPIPKLIEHYLLVGDLMVDEDVLVAAARYVARFQPEVGVDVERAQQARHVTILGGSEALSPVVEEALRAAECEVDRVEGDLATELRARVEAGRPW
jgi:hypothetical protein